MSGIETVGVIAAWGWLFWTLATVAIVWLRDAGREAPRVARIVRAELRPVALPLLLLEYLPNLLSRMSGWDWLWFVLGLAFWLIYRKDRDDDDRWKRRRKKLADKVAEVGGRLVVQPVGAS